MGAEFCAPAQPEANNRIRNRQYLEVIIKYSFRFHHSSYCLISLGARGSLPTRELPVVASVHQGAEICMEYTGQAASRFAFADILYEKKEGIARVTLNHPE